MILKDPNFQFAKKPVIAVIKVEQVLRHSFVNELCKSVTAMAVSCQTCENC